MTPGRKFWISTSALASNDSQGRKIGLVFQVDREAFLGAVDGMENGRIAANFGIAEIKPAGEVAAIRPLDLDDTSAKIHQRSEA